MAKRSGRRQLTLRNWGLIIIFSGLMTAVISNTLFPVEGNTRQARGERAGRATAQGVMIVAGVTILVVDTIRRSRGGPKKSAHRHRRN